jgi:hypothetical protein
MRISYRKISIQGTKPWRGSDGHRYRKTKTFWQTVNPHNKNADGSQKTGEQIYKEICRDRDEWLNSAEA